MTLRAEVDEDLCMSSGRCVADAPTAFAFNDDELAYAKDGAASVDERELRSIALNCPAGAIRVLDDDAHRPVG